MKQITTVVDLLSFIELVKRKNKTIGFVPTMGSLHEGHDSLLRKCQNENDISIVSIYVNPSHSNGSFLGDPIALLYWHFGIHPVLPKFR